ncbi:MAG: hypothetical protein Dbin4_03125 [Alphaproteobacteria bacterium]|nr:hypothetical protein [Alphaproteobacteria bacterium]
MVVATGMDTEIGRISAMLSGTEGVGLITWSQIIAVSAALFFIVEIEKAVFRSAASDHRTGV